MTTRENPDKDPGTRINVEFGCELFLQIQVLKERLSSHLVGLIPDVCLIIKTPHSLDTQEFLAEGTRIVLRYVHLGQVYGFRSTVVRSIRSPAKLTFLSYPEKIEKINLRKEARVSCYIPASVILKKKEIKGVITNISQGGVKFTTRSLEDPEANPVAVEQEVQLSFPVLGVKGIQKFRGQVQNKKCDRKELSLGISFLKIDAELAGMLDTYVKEVKAYDDQ